MRKIVVLEFSRNLGLWMTCVLDCCQKRIVRMLVSKLTHDYHYYDNSSQKVKKEIAVLSQYKAQCSFIQKELETEGFAECTVRTVVASQG